MPFLFFIYLAFCAAVAYIFRYKKGGFWVHFLLSFIFTPFIGFIISLLVPSDHNRKILKKLKTLAKLHKQGLFSEEDFTKRKNDLSKDFKI